ncbi:MAG TPA: hypothetical protein VEK08_23410 [Planctomycetota bacterium]|nr:hypothetical protein [Planctomycetota bacterium]
MKKVQSAIILLSLLVFAGCGGGAKTTQTPSNTAPNATAQLPEGVLLKEAPAGAKDVSTVKKEAKAGDEVVMKGRIAGDKDVFVPQRAMFVLADTKLLACSERPGDNCPYPWDLCCETPETLKESTATVQLVDANGKPLKMDLKGVNGIKELSVLVVKGKVADREGGRLLVTASGIFIEPAAVK